MKKLGLFALLFYALSLCSMEAERVETLCKMVVELDLKTRRLSEYKQMDVEQLYQSFHALDVSGKKIGMKINDKSTDLKTYLLLRLRCARFALDTLHDETPHELLGKYLIPRCITIQILNLSNNELTELPDELFEFKNLKKLFVAHNKITLFPDRLLWMPSLEEVDLSHNQIETVGTKFQQIGIDKALVRFNIAHNRLSKNEQEMLIKEWKKNKKIEQLIVSVPEK